jgi:membrane peptidoglycan carboxypeptidase
MAHSAVIPAALDSANYQNTIVYYNDGKTVMGTIGTVNRQDLTYQQLPANLKNAVLAAEDKNFFTEGGISPTGILRSAYDDLVNGGTAGGSTITQEFVRNYYDGVGVAQTPSRKIKEIFIAQKLAGEKSKPWILTSYLNLIYLGDQSYGVAAAAQTYFGLPVNKLSVAQDVVLASIIQQPSNYPQLQYRDNLKARWTAVLGDMVKDNFITQAQADAATFPKLLTDTPSSTPVNAVGVTANNSDPWALYILSVVSNELTGVDHVTQQQLETGGLGWSPRSAARKKSRCTRRSTITSPPSRRTVVSSPRTSASAPSCRTRRTARSSRRIPGPART